MPCLLSNVACYLKARKTAIKSIFISTENIRPNCAGIEQYVDSSTVEGIAFTTSDILIANIRPYLKKAWQATFNGVCSTDVLALHITNALPEFIYRIIENDNFFTYVMSAAKGSKMPRGDKQHIMDYHIAIPRIQEQQKISDFLQHIDLRIAKQRQLIDSLISYKRGLFLTIFNNKNDSWKKYKLSDFVQVCGGYAFNSKTYTINGHYTVLTIGNVTGKRYVDISEAKRISKIPKDLQPYQRLNIGDLVISMTGNVGRVSIVNNENCLLNQRVAKLVFNDMQYKEILFQILSCGDFTFVMEQKGQGAAQKNIKNSDIENYEFLLPPTIEQVKILSNVFKLLDAIIEKEGKKLDFVLQTKSALLQQLFI